VGCGENTLIVVNQKIVKLGQTCKERRLTLKANSKVAPQNPPIVIQVYQMPLQYEFVAEINRS
jgi:hypothetical protein